MGIAVNKNLNIKNGVENTMKVILQADIKGIGKKDQVVNASDGYSRNYLFPNKLAIPADKQNMKELSEKKSSQDYKKGEEKKQAIKIKGKIEKEVLKLKVKAGENGKTFGSITSKEISENIEKQLNEKIDKKKILLQEQIKNVGEYTINIKLFEGVNAKLKIEVIAE